MKRTQVIGGLLAAFAIALYCVVGLGTLLAGKGGKGGGGTSGPPATPITYGLITFGPPPGGSGIGPSAMNNHTEVVGAFTSSISGVRHAFYYSLTSGTIVDLNDQFRNDGLLTPDGGPFTFDDVTLTGWLVLTADDINDSGQITCVLVKADNGTALSELPARYTPAGASPTGTAQLDFLEWDTSANGWAGNAGYGINNNGYVTGGGFLWTDAYVDQNGWLIANPLPYGMGGVNDDNGSGLVQVIGGDYRYTLDVNSFQVTDYITLGTLFPNPKHNDSILDSANCINNSGDVAGVSTNFSWTQGMINEGWRYTDSQGLVGLGTLGGNHSGANSINAYGDVIGVSDTSAGDWHLYLYSDAFGGMTDLSAALSVNYPNVVLTDTCGCTLPTAINDSGVICGYTPDGQYGYILTPQP